MSENEALAAQIVDDVNIECTPIPDGANTRPYRRAHLTVAMDSVRTLLRNDRAVKGGKVADSVELRNGQLLNAVRTIAMLHSYGQGDKTECKVRERGYSKIRATIGDKSNKAIAEVIKLAKSKRMRARAISVLTALMETKESNENEYDEDERPTGENEIFDTPTSGTGLEGKSTICTAAKSTLFPPFKLVCGSSPL